MSRSIHTTTKDLKRERLFSVHDDVSSTPDITELERDDIKKRVHKLNTKRKRQAEKQDAPGHAQLKVETGGLVRDARKRRPKHVA